MPPLFPLTLAFFAVAATLCFVAMAQPQSAWRRFSFPVLLLGVLAQSFDIAWLCLHGQHPGSSAREAIYFASWLMMLALSGLTARPRYRPHGALLGALLLPVALVMDVLVRVVPVSHGAVADRFGMGAVAPRLVSLHIFSATLGTALFGIAAAASAVYLLSERRLRHRGSGGHAPVSPGSDRALPVWRGPSLETLDSWNQQSIAFGMLAFTSALVSGTSWLIQVAPIVHMGLPAAGGGSLLSTARYLFGQSRYMLAVLTWLIYAGLLLGRAAFGLRGRRAAKVTILGFLTALAVLAVYFVRDLRAPL